MKSRTRLSVCASFMLAGMVLLPGCGGDGNEEPEFVVPSDSDPGAGNRPQVTLTYTNNDNVSGSVVITLLPEYAPVTVANFLNYVNSGFYDGTIFHRRQSGFVMQGGGYVAPVSATDTPDHKPTNAPIALEVKVSNVRGTVAMARTDNPNSATSEFFINLTNNSSLNTRQGGYAAFGYITNMVAITNTGQAACVSSVITQGTSLGCLPVPNLVITSAVQTRF